MHDTCSYACKHVILRDSDWLYALHTCYIYTCTYIHTDIDINIDIDIDIYTHQKCRLGILITWFIHTCLNTTHMFVYHEKTKLLWISYFPRQLHTLLTFNIAIPKAPSYSTYFEYRTSQGSFILILTLNIAIPKAPSYSTYFEYRNSQGSLYSTYFKYRYSQGSFILHNGAGDSGFFHLHALISLLELNYQLAGLYTTL